MVKTKKTKKSVKLRGTNSHGHGARKKWKGKGHHGGKGMAGTGKRADHKKTLINKLYGNKYFGKRGITSRGTERKKNNVINLEQIQKDISSLMKKFGKDNVLNLKGYKILGKGDLKQKLTINAKEFSKTAKEKIEKIGGEAVLLKKAKVVSKDKEEKIDSKGEESPDPFKKGSTQNKPQQEVTSQPPLKDSEGKEQESQ